MKKILFSILIINLVLAMMIFCYRVYSFYNNIHKNNDLIKQELNNKTLNWSKINWLELQNKYLITIPQSFKKILVIIPWFQKDIVFQDNIRLVINFIQDLQNGSFIQNVINNNQNYLNILSRVYDLKQYFNNDNLVVLNTFFNDLNYWYNFLGYDTAKNYLIIYQLPSIARPTGGLITSYSTLTLDKGGVTNCTFDTALALDDLMINKIIPPEPLQLINNRWLFHDGNWFFDFPTSAEHLINWYQQTSLTPNINGIISVNISVIQDFISILKLSPEVNLDNLLINSLTNNIQTINIQAVKDSLNDLMANFASALKSQSQDNIKLFQNKIFNYLKTKDIQIYCTDDALEYYLDTLNFSGKVVNYHNDYLAINFINLSPTFKVNNSIKRISLNTNFASSTIINTLTIGEDKGAMNPESYLQIYLPNNIHILKVEGSYLKPLLKKLDYNKLGYTSDNGIIAQEKTMVKDELNKIIILKDDNKTIIGMWAKPSIKPVRITYQLLDQNLMPSEWQIIFQKQSGLEEQITYNIIPPADKQLKSALFPLNKPFMLTEDIELKYIFE